MPAPDRDDVAALLEEARRAGRADAFAVLRERWRDAYLTAATTPAPVVQDGEAFWVYGVADAPVTVADGLGPVEAVEAHGLHALVSRVPLAEFGDEPLRAHLEDLAWVERVARAHERVLEEALAQATVVPLRLCTICLTRERVVDLLGAQAPDLHAAIGRLRGRSEWGVKVFAQRETQTPVAAEDGASYLEQRRAARDRREHASADIARIHDTLAAVAVAAVANPPQQREAHGRDADMVLNGAYLVDDARADEFRRAAEEAGGELTGPWPPYNFVAVDA